MRPRRSHLGWPVRLVAGLCALLGLAGTAGGAPSPPTATAARATPLLLPGARAGGQHGFLTAVTVGGLPVVSIARVAAPTQAGSSVTLLHFDQSVHLVLHAGTLDPGGSGWPHGPAVSRGESHKLLAAFNGGFRLNTGAGGFREKGRVGYPLRNGAASVVTYADGHTDIGAWGSQVPARGARIASVRQNLTLLVNGGRPAGTVGCIPCWGATLGGGPSVARAAIAVTADGSLLWGAGETLTPRALALALVGQGAQRAVELDINPQWVAGYLYAHGGGHASPVGVVPGQAGVGGAFLSPYTRDFFSVVSAR